MSKFTTVEVDGHTFTFRRLPPDETLDRLAELQSITLGIIDLSLPDGNDVLTEVQVGVALTRALLSLFSKLGRERMRAVRALLLDPDYVSIGDGSDARKLTPTELVKQEVDASTLTKLLVEAFKIVYLPVFFSAGSVFGMGQSWTPANLLSALSALKSPA